MNLEQRLDRLEAIEAIRQLKARYFHACDHQQPEVVRECFPAGPIDLRYGRIGNFSDREQLLAGVYDDAYLRCDGQWRITRSYYEVTSTQISTCPKAWRGSSSPE